MSSFACCPVQLYPPCSSLAMPLLATHFCRKWLPIRLCLLLVRPTVLSILQIPHFSYQSWLFLKTPFHFHLYCIIGFLVISLQKQFFLPECVLLPRRRMAWQTDALSIVQKGQHTHKNANYNFFLERQDHSQVPALQFTHIIQ